MRSWQCFNPFAHFNTRIISCSISQGINIYKLNILKYFLIKFSSANSQRNIETCGVLFGMMIDAAIELTHVLLPKQKGTHDSCVTTNEEQILEFQGYFRH